LAWVAIGPAAQAAHYFWQPRLKEEIKPIMAYLSVHRQENDVVYIYYGAEKPFLFYSGLFGIREKNIIYGSANRGHVEKYIQELNQLRGSGRVWFVFSHNFDWGGVDEQAHFLNYLEKVGRPLDQSTAYNSSLYLYELSPLEPLQLGRTYHFARGADGNQFLGEGFSHPESWGTWTDAKDAFLFFQLGTAPPAPLSIAIEASSLSPEADRKQIVAVVANGHACGQLVVTSSRPDATITCPAGAFGAGDNVLHLQIARPTRPVDLGMNADHRPLGLGLMTLTLTPKE